MFILRTKGMNSLANSVNVRRFLSSMVGNRCGLPESLAIFYQKWFLDTLSVPACCTEHKASSTLLHLPFVDARGQER